MNKALYYANLLILPVFFALAFVMNLYKLTKQAWRWSVNETKDAYRSNRRHYNV
jgi:hypothetical protein